MIDQKRKLIIGWSPKCGCSHLKRIFFHMSRGVPLQDLQDVGYVHRFNSSQALPKDCSQFTAVVVGRNPFKRLISGFLDKYKPGGEYRKLWGPSPLTFSKFVDELVAGHYRRVDRHHFAPQTAEGFDLAVMGCKSVEYFDLGKIDYVRLSQLFGRRIPSFLMEPAHSRKHYFAADQDQQSNLPPIDYQDIAHVPIEQYIFHRDIDYGKMYTVETKRLVRKFFAKDFQLFEETFGVKYDV